MNTLYRLLFISVICFYCNTSYSQQTALSDEEIQNRLQREKARNLQLPQDDGHYKRTKKYVEDTPQSDYFHASEASYESFRDMKFGVRIHWGIYSMWELNGESWGFLSMPNEKKQEYQELYKTFNPTAFNANDWMTLFKRAGIRCMAFTAKHHEGFSMFDTRTKVNRRINYVTHPSPRIELTDLSYSIMETPFKRDVVKELCEAAHKSDIKIDLYFSHPDWYDADFRPYNYHPLQTDHAKDNPQQYGGEDLFRRSPQIMVPPTSQTENRAMVTRHREQLKELLTNYGKIDMLCLDQWMGAPNWPDMRETVKFIRTLQPDVMLRARGIGNYGDYYTPEGFVPGEKEPSNLPWMVIYPLASSFSYDKEAANYKGTQWIIDNLVDAVAKGGNFMVGIGPDKNGTFHPSAVSQLIETGKWLDLNGEGIYNTRARIDWKEGDNIRYTTTKDSSVVYAFAKDWPEKELLLQTVTPVKGSKIYLLGYSKPLKWKQTEKGLIIKMPSVFQNEKARPGSYTRAFKIQIW